MMKFVNANFVFIFLALLIRRITSTGLKINHPPMLPVDCLQYNISGYECRNYVGISIFSYAGFSQSGTSIYTIPSQGYLPSVPPQDTIFYPVKYFNLNQHDASDFGLSPKSPGTTLQVSVDLQIDKMYGIDDVAATMKTSIIFGVSWYEPRLTWNSTLTPFSVNYCSNECNYTHTTSVLLNENNVRLSNDYVWTPDLTLLNSASDDSNLVNYMAGSNNLLLHPNGLVNWKMKGNVEAYCQLHLQWFPFDKQTCTLELSSRSYYLLNGLNFSVVNNFDHRRLSASVSDSTSTVSLLTKSFEDSLTWTTQNVDVKRVEKTLIENNFQSIQSVLVYTITLERNSKFYIRTAIVPNILVTSLSVGSLWIADYPSRLGLNITALLTVIAILVCDVYFLFIFQFLFNLQQLISILVVY